MKGKLKFISFFHPIEVGGKDVRAQLFSFLETSNGKKMKMDYTKDDFCLKENTEAEFHLEYKNDSDGILMILQKTDGFGMSNLGAYIPDHFQRLNGRKISIEFEENKMTIKGDPKEKVFGVYYTEDNRCAVSDEDVTRVCKLGTNSCCIFLCAGSGGFECLKFSSPSARSLLYRFANNEMNATRIGNCKILGRKESSIELQNPERI